MKFLLLQNLFSKFQADKVKSPDLLRQNPLAFKRGINRVTKAPIYIGITFLLIVGLIMGGVIFSKSSHAEAQAKEQPKPKGEPAASPDFLAQHPQTGKIGDLNEAETLPAAVDLSVPPKEEDMPSAFGNAPVNQAVTPSPYQEYQFQQWQQREQQRQALEEARRNTLQNALGSNTTIYANNQAGAGHPQLATLYGAVKQQGTATGPENGQLDYSQPQRSNVNIPSEPPDTANYLMHTRVQPVSPFEVKAGTVIPSVMIGGVNSELPGQIIAQVSQNVYDTATGRHLLIPQGARLVGNYDHQVVSGQKRVLVIWNRLIYPDASSVNLGGMMGSDQSGYAGFKDKTNTHFWPTFRNALLLSAITAGVQLSQPRAQSGDYSYSSQQMVAGALGMQMNQLGAATIARNLSQAPTITIRPGYVFNVMVNKDVILPPWQGSLADQGNGY